MFVNAIFMFVVPGRREVICSMSERPKSNRVLCSCYANIGGIPEGNQL